MVPLGGVVLLERDELERDREVDKVKVDVVQPEIGEGFLAGRLDVLLGLDKYKTKKTKNQKNTKTKTQNTKTTQGADEKEARLVINAESSTGASSPASVRQG